MALRPPFFELRSFVQFRPEQLKWLPNNKHSGEENIAQEPSLAPSQKYMNEYCSFREPTTVMYCFGQSHAQPANFDFTPSTQARQWPGPSFRGEMPFGPRVTPRVKRNPKHKSASAVLVPPSSLPSQKRSRLARTQLAQKRASKKVATSSEPARIGSQDLHRTPPAVFVSTRNSLLHLLALPAEIRNLIYGYVAISDAPLTAQFRPIHSLKGKEREPLVRRFPQEPTLASASHQLRSEVLSIFYAKNRFVFKRDKAAALADFNMLAPSMLLRWDPEPCFSSLIRHVELRFQPNVRAVFEANVTFKRDSEDVATATLKVKHKCECSTCNSIAERLKSIGPWEVNQSPSLIAGAVSLLEKGDLCCFETFDRFDERQL